MPRFHKLQVNHQLPQQRGGARGLHGVAAREAAEAPARAAQCCAGADAGRPNCTPPPQVQKFRSFWLSQHSKGWTAFQSSRIAAMLASPRTPARPHAVEEDITKGLLQLFREYAGHDGMLTHDALRSALSDCIGLPPTSADVDDLASRIMGSGSSSHTISQVKFVTAVLAWLDTPPSSRRMPPASDRVSARPAAAARAQPPDPLCACSSGEQVAGEGELTPQDAIQASKTGLFHGQPPAACARRRPERGPDSLVVSRFGPRVKWVCSDGGDWHAGEQCRRKVRRRSARHSPASHIHRRARSAELRELRQRVRTLTEQLRDRNTQVTELTHARDVAVQRNVALEVRARACGCAVPVPDALACGRTTPAS